MKDLKELSNIIKHSRIVYDRKWEFSGVVSNQRQMTINIKTPIPFKSILEEKIKLIEPLIFEIYEDDYDYYANEVTVSVLASKVTKIKIDEMDREIISDSIYQNFIKDISSMNLDNIEKYYL